LALPPAELLERVMFALPPAGETERILFALRERTSLAILVFVYGGL